MELLTESTVLERPRRRLPTRCDTGRRQRPLSTVDSWANGISCLPAAAEFPLSPPADRLEDQPVKLEQS